MTLPAVLAELDEDARRVMSEIAVEGVPEEGLSAEDCVRELRRQPLKARMAEIQKRLAGASGERAGSAPRGEDAPRAADGGPLGEGLQGAGGTAMALSIEEKYDEVRQLITMGKEKGYLLYEEVNDLLPSDLGSSDELDDIFSMFGSMGIEVVDSEQKFREKSEEEGVELDLTPGALDKTNDPVRMYLREMGTVPLLTREGEVEIAKRIERGKNAMLRAISRTNMAAQEVARLGERLGAREIGVRDAVVFNEEEVTEEKLEAKIKETLKLIGKANQAHQDYLAYRKHFTKLERKSRGYVKGKWRLGRLRIRMSLAIRRIEFAESFKRRLVERIRETVDRIRRRRGPHRAARGEAQARRERRLPQAGPHR